MSGFCLYGLHCIILSYFILYVLKNIQRVLTHLFSFASFSVLHDTCFSASADHAHSKAMQGRSLSGEGEEFVGEVLQEEGRLEEERDGQRVGKMRRQAASVDREDAEEEEPEEGVAQRTVSETDLR